MSRVRPACGSARPALVLVNIRDIARTSKRKRELTINTDVGDLSLLRALNEGAK